MTHDELREKVARAILSSDQFLVESGHDKWQFKTPAQKEHYRNAATAAIAVALEEAANIVTAKSDEVGDLGIDGYETAVRWLDDAAAAIRALISADASGS